MPDLQIKWLLYNIYKDKEEKYKVISDILDTLKIYINRELYNEEQQMKKDNQHKTVLDETLKTEFKDKGLSDDQLKQLEQFFKD